LLCIVAKVKSSDNLYVDITLSAVP